MGISQIGGSTNSGSSANIIYAALPTSELTVAANVSQSDTALTQTVTGKRFVIQYEFALSITSLPCYTGAFLSWSGASVQAILGTVFSPGNAQNTSYPTGEYTAYAFSTASPLTVPAGVHCGSFMRNMATFHVTLTASAALTFTPGITHTGGNNGSTSATVGYRRLVTTVIAA